MIKSTDIRAFPRAGKTFSNKITGVMESRTDRDTSCVWLRRRANGALFYFFAVSRSHAHRVGG